MILMILEYEVSFRVVFLLHSFILTYSIKGCKVAQLRIIFAPKKTCNGVPFFAYIQPFKTTASAKNMADSDIKMYKLVRDLRGDHTRKGLIVPLTSIWRPVELIPKFGKTCNKDWTCDTAVESSKEFYLNCFADKSTYIEVY